MGVTKALQRFDGDEEVDFPRRNEVRVNRLIGDAQVRLHRSAALTHAMDLGLFHVHAAGDRSARYRFGDREDSLTADTCKDDVLLHRES